MTGVAWLPQLGDQQDEQRAAESGSPPLLTMEIYTEAPSDATRDALRKLSDWLT